MSASVLKTKQIPKPNYKLCGGPVFTCNLPGGRFVFCFPRQLRHFAEKRKKQQPTENQKNTE